VLESNHCPEKYSRRAYFLSLILEKVIFKLSKPFWHMFDDVWLKNVGGLHCIRFEETSFFSGFSIKFTIPVTVHEHLPYF